MLFSPFICGSFHHQEAEDDMEELRMLSPSSTPRRSSRKSIRFSCRSKETKNPYSDRGLDKFSALLADLDDKRQKIYTQKGSEDISFVRFVYSNSDDAKPIVVKVRDRKKERNDGNFEHAKSSKQLTRNQSEVSANVVSQPKPDSDQNIRKKLKSSSSMKMEDRRRPSSYMPVIIILILIFLAVFGRSLAILCTSIGWYMIPIVGGGDSSNSKRPIIINNKKKEYTRRASDVKVVASENGGVSSPRSVITGINDMSPKQHAHRRSW